MSTLTHKQFEQRWQQAKAQTGKPQNLKTPVPDLQVSLDTVLDNYAALLKQAVRGHAITEAQCQQLCDKLNELKQLNQPLKDAIAPYLKA